MKLKVKKLYPDAKLPTRATEHSIGLDLYAYEDADCLCWGDIERIRTGIAVEIPRGYYGRIAPRSGWAARCGVGTLAGVIDADYRGEIVVILALHQELDCIPVKKGDRIAQLILERADIFEVEEVDELSETDRGAGGFGSTGV